jgi:hypothetical protein
MNQMARFANLSSSSLSTLAAAVAMAAAASPLAGCIRIDAVHFHFGEKTYCATEQAADQADTPAAFERDCGAAAQQEQVTP